jgi:arabinan endo-1,5-alpha-L-arabinosidase
VLRRAPFGRVALGLLAGVALVVTAPSPLGAGASVGASAGASSPQPPATPTPQAPGIQLVQGNFDLPDPYLLDVKGKYYMYLSAMFYNRNQNVPLLEGSPGQWAGKTVETVETVGKMPSWAATNPNKGGLSWGPEVYKMGGTYVMYFAPTILNSLPVVHCIALATASSPAGPFTVQSEPFLCQRSLGGDIDAGLFVDKNGPDGPAHPNYLIWKSDNNSTPGDGPPHIWAQPLSNDGRHLLGQAVDIYAPEQAWQENLIEAPQMALSPDGTVWLFFSAGVGYSTPTYGIGVVHCTSPLGPCTGGDSKPILTNNQQGPGPGEETYFTARDGSDWLLYSPWYTGDPIAPWRPVEAVRIGWSPVGPYLAAAGTFPKP